MFGKGILSEKKGKGAASRLQLLYDEPGLSRCLSTKGKKGRERGVGLDRENFLLKNL